MAKKRLDTAAIADELAHSAFFAATPAPAHQARPQTGSSAQDTEGTRHAPLAVASARPSPAQTVKARDANASTEMAAPSTVPPVSDLDVVSEHQWESEQASGHASSNASMLAHQQANHPSGVTALQTSHAPVRDSTHSSAHEEEPGDDKQGIVEAIRKCVKQVGKEVSFVRLTPEEKRQLADIAYTYKSQGIKTSENEISRVGINWMLEDYHAHGQASVLAKVLAALNA